MIARILGCATLVGLSLLKVIGTPSSTLHSGGIREFDTLFNNGSLLVANVSLVCRCPFCDSQLKFHTGVCPFSCARGGLLSVLEGVLHSPQHPCSRIRIGRVLVQEPVAACHIYEGAS